MDLIVALDYSSIKKADELIESISSDQVVLKIGYELFIHAGPEWIKKLTNQNRRVFLDLKLHDIPNTVAKAISNISALGVEMTTIHLLGGHSMMKRAREEVTELDSKLKLLGVSVLTSTNQNHWDELLRDISESEHSIPLSVQGLVKRNESLLDGVVCSAAENQIVKKANVDLYTVIPGIRPAGFESLDQSRVYTPLQAKKLGADAIVVGRPITQSPHPEKVVKDILSEIGT